MPVKTRSQEKQVSIPDSIPRNAKGYPSIGQLTIKKSVMLHQCNKLDLNQTFKR
jgi:hypothetical protein